MAKPWKNLTWFGCSYYYKAAVQPLLTRLRYPTNPRYRPVRDDLQRLFDLTRQMLQNGFCEAELWGLDSTIRAFVLPRLVKFRCWFEGRSTPRRVAGREDTENKEELCDEDFLSAEEWCQELDKMILAFQLLDADDGWLKQNQVGPVREGLDSFRTWRRK
jgi:hypothetical protein